MTEETIEDRLTRNAAIADHLATDIQSLGQMTREDRHKLLYGHPEKARLVDRLCDDPDERLRRLHISPGPGNFTEEELCREMNRAFDQVANGTAKVSTSFEDDCPKVDVREWLKKFD